jgi:peptidoglycan/xylan/chitin deacetylase (PgdA/CDA1 family)
MRAESNAMPYVLMYHSVAPYEEDPFLVTVNPERFEEQIRWMSRRGLRGVSVRELLAAEAAGRARGLVGLTFDDGYTDFLTHVVPTLIRHNFTATVFMVAGRMGGHNDWEEYGPSKSLLTVDELRQVAEAGMEIGSHGLHHMSLPKATDAELAEELERSRAILTETIGQDVTGFCYPYGHLEARSVEAVRTAGYDYGCAIWRSELTGRHALPRTYIGDRDGSLRLYAKRVRHRLASGAGAR